MKQYAIFYAGVVIEYTRDYFKTPAAVRRYVKKRYKDAGSGVTFCAVGEKTFYTV